VIANAEEVSIGTDVNDRLALVYQEAVRGIAHQERVVESLITRAGNLILAAAFVSSLLGGRAIADGLD
jgi:hypothetical protein